MASEDVTELLKSHDKTLMDKELHLMDKQRKWFPEIAVTSGEDAWKTVEMTTDGLEYHTHLVDKLVALFEWIWP